MLTLGSRHEEAEAGYCVKGSNSPERCGGAGCYSPDVDICCHCTGDLKGRKLFRGALRNDPTVKCSAIPGCRD